jgi:hypothetical protein
MKLKLYNALEEVHISLILSPPVLSHVSFSMSSLLAEANKPTELFRYHSHIYYFCTIKPMLSKREYINASN